MLVIPDSLAVIVDDPAATPVATPVDAIVAAAVFEDAHVTVEVMFCVVLLLYVPVAVKVCVVPAAMEPVVGVIAIVVSVAAVTVMVAELPVIPDSEAVIIEDPAATPVATPLDAMVAAAVFDDAHVTEEVMFCVLSLL